ncbi:mannitol dehydrogenase family protein [Rhizobium sp. YIM 134829]|uniref:mannitol dehydrogenase family protein n=1 Tax=Rhizobium sp. YIM 134829 TaxID=3390453 RepID=UPI00397C6E1B
MTASIPTPIVQFGTSRFLQAHVDLFVSEAMERGAARGPITIVQTTGSADRAGRLSALAAPGGYPVIIRGIEDGRPVERRQQVTSVTRALSTAADWAEISRIVVEEAEILLSNTGDAGYAVGEDDEAGGLPASFPGKLLRLLQARFAAGGRGLTILPCELLPRNGSVLKRILLDLSERRIGDAAFTRWLDTALVWGNSLVDRIVSEPLQPAGAVAEPYALWAIERQPGLQIPCTHPAIRLVEDLDAFEALKLHILNLGHTVLADIWLKQGRDADETVRAILADPAVKQRLLDIYAQEVIPAFAAKGLGAEAEAYVAETLQRFENPFLDHRLRDIAQNHAEKIRRRLAGLREWSPEVPLPEIARIIAG